MIFTVLIEILILSMLIVSYIVNMKHFRKTTKILMIVSLVLYLLLNSFSLVKLVCDISNWFILGFDRIKFGQINMIIVVVLMISSLICICKEKNFVRLILLLTIIVYLIDNFEFWTFAMFFIKNNNFLN